VSGKQVCTLPLPEPAGGEVDRLVYHVCLSADGNKARAVFGPQGVFSSVGQGEVVRPTDWLGTWELPGGNLLAKVGLSATYGKHSSLSHDGKSLVTHSGVINLDVGKERARLEG